MTLKIGAKLYSGFGVIVLFLIMSGVGAWLNSSSVMVHYEKLNDNTRGSVELANVERGIWQLRFGIANYPGADAAGRAKIVADEATSYADIKRALEAYGSLAI